MGYFSYYLISALFLVLWTIISWVVTDLLHLKGTTEMLVRVLLMSLGGCVFGLVFWLKQRRERRKAAQAGAALAGVTAQQEIDFLLRTAEGKLVSSRLGSSRFRSGLVFSM